MATQTESMTGLFEQAAENLRKVAATNLEMQEEFFRKWSKGWPGFPQPQSEWSERVQKFQKAWAKTMKELSDKHREVLDEHYRMAVDSMQEAFRVSQSSDPEEFTTRCESLCRKSLEVMREAAELQAKELQEAFTKWTKLMTKSAE